MPGKIPRIEHRCLRSFSLCTVIRTGASLPFDQVSKPSFARILHSQPLVQTLIFEVRILLEPCLDEGVKKAHPFIRRQPQLRGQRVDRSNLTSERQQRFFFPLYPDQSWTIFAALVAGDGEFRRQSSRKSASSLISKFCCLKCFAILLLLPVQILCRTFLLRLSECKRARGNHNVGEYLCVCASWDAKDIRDLGDCEREVCG